MSITVELIDEAGNTQNLSNGALTEFVALEGAGVPSVRRILESGPLIHGAVDRGHRLEPRQMTLILAFEDDRSGTGDTTRDTLARIFGPTDNPLKLKYTRDDTTVKQIDCYLDGKIDFQQVSISRTGRQDVMIPLIAPDPTWYFPTQQVDTKSLSSGSNLFTASAVGLTWHDWPIFEAIGPLTNLFINHNAFGSASLSFSGSTIAGGETYTIDLRPGHKTILDSGGTSQISKLTNATVPNMFGLLRIHDEKYLDAYGLSSPTDNNISMSATGTTGASQVVVKWYKRYINL